MEAEDDDVPPEPGVTVEVDHHSIPELTVRDVAARLGQAGFHVYDTNNRARWRRSHLPGARNLDDDEFDRGQLPEDTQATLVFYCWGPGCHSCHAAAARARQFGYQDVYVMPEGIGGWEKARHPIETA